MVTIPVSPVPSVSTNSVNSTGSSGSSSSSTPPSPVRSAEFSASWLSHLFFTWVNPLFTIGNRKNYSLQEKDLLPLSDVDEPVRISSQFEQYIHEAQTAGYTNPVTRAVRQQFGAPMMWAGVVKLLNSTLQFAPPILLNYFLKYLQQAQILGYGETEWEGYVWGVALFVALSTRTVTENNYFHRVVRVGYQLRMAITTAVYRKSLRLSPVARQEVPVGQIVNLMQQDATKLDGMCMQAHVIWDGLYQIIGYMVLLFIYIGPSALAGLGMMVILIPINVMMMIKMMGLRRNIVKHNDNRIKITNEVLQGIRPVKLYGWESSFLTRLAGIREDELIAIKKYAVQNAVNTMLMQTAPILVGIVTLLVFAGTGGDFTPATVFTAISVLNNLRFPLMFYPMVLQQVAEARVSFERLNKFLLQPEVGVVALTDNDQADNIIETKDTGSSVSTATTTAVTGETEHVVIETNPMRVNDQSSNSSSAAIHKLDTVHTPASVAANALSTDAAGIRIKSGVFYWENPTSRRDRLRRKAEEEAKAKAKTKGKKPSTPPAKPATPASTTPATPTPAPATPTTPSKTDDPNAPIYPVLNNMNFTIPAGQLWAVVGPVGSGKSALCSAILGELARNHGDVNINGRLAYVSQTAWVLNATLKRNITFAGDAHNMDGGSSSAAAEARYQKVLDVCSLRSDLSVLPAGDATEIGERGINLSGGQKQRVAIARAAYSGADVYLFDDPLSALDAEVGKSVFENAICGLLQNTTRLLVTNALQYLPQCDGVIVLKSNDQGVGHIAYAGAFNELMTTVPDFTAMMNEYGHSHAGSKENDGTNTSSVPTEKESSISATSAKPKTEGSTPSTAAVVAANKTLMTVEEKNEGVVRGEYYWRYLGAGGNVVFILSVLFWAYALGQLAQLVSQWWITFWTADKSYVLHDEGFYMGIFVALGIAASLLSFVRVLIMAYMGIRASRTLHAKVLDTVLKAPMAFFDTTPLGRLISRFSKDVESIDQQLPNQLGMLWMCIFFVVGTLAAIIFATPWFALVVLPVTVVYVHIMNYFRNVSRETKRFDSITRSPIFAHFSETLGGLSVIRAYALQNDFAKQNEDKVARNVSAWYTLKSCDRWLSIRLEILGNVIVLAAALLAVGTTISSSRKEGTSAGLAGFSLSYAMAITGLMNWLVRTAAETEQMMNSVERICHYIDTTPTEPYDNPRDKETGKPLPPALPPTNWPADGKVEYRDYRMRYRDNTPEVLHGVNFSIPGGSKVGIVGRTGSGKSSLMVSLFRLIEDNCHSGTISIDGIDIDQLGLTELRSHLAIIPQDPVMFSGTIRSNLDPINAITDDNVLWDAIEKVGLGDVVRRLPGGLNGQIAEFGESLSVGQRQLICLARVLLRKSKIILLDEATSSVDYATDQAMQRVIRESFAQCTILTIAHRLNTIITSDTIILMNDGIVSETGSPGELLSNPSSGFSALVDELGVQTATSLRNKAIEIYQEKGKNNTVVPVIPSSS